MFGVSGTGDTSGYGGLRQPVVYPGAAQRPYGGWFDEVAESRVDGVAEIGVSDAIEKVVVHRGEITFFIRRERLLETAQLLRDDPALRYEMCLGVSGVHYPNERGRELHAVYHLLSMTHNRRIRVEVVCPDEALHNVVGTREGMFGVQGSGDTSGYGGLRTTVEMPGGSPAPDGGGVDEGSAWLVERFAAIGASDAL